MNKEVLYLYKERDKIKKILDEDHKKRYKYKE